MKLLVVGNLGLVGSATQELFAAKNWEVVGVDNNMRSRLFGTPYQEGAHLDLDIRDYDRVLKLFREKGPFDAIVHTAAQPSHDYSIEHPMSDFFVNVVGTLNLLEATRLYSPKATFVYVSSDKVYGLNASHPDLEEKETRYDHPVAYNESLSVDKTTHTPFGVGKASADLYVQEYGHTYGIKTACFRCGCITGSKHQGNKYHGFLSFLAKTIKEGGTYTIRGFKGKQVRDQIHASDLANAFWHFIEKPTVGAVYNMGGGRERSVSILEAGELLSKKLGKPFKYQVIEETQFGDMQWDIHDTSKFKKDYPAWDYKYSLTQIIDELCA